jgi:hypothetical protein
MLSDEELVLFEVFPDDIFTDGAHGGAGVVAG